MGWLDKLLGRGKQAAGDVVGDSSLHREGVQLEAQAAAEERADQSEDLAQSAREDAAEHSAERET
jgi:uncharacterized protein YjbJ (UPF0337 family)